MTESLTTGRVREEDEEWWDGRGWDLEAGWDVLVGVSS